MAGSINKGYHSFLAGEGGRAHTGGGMLIVVIFSCPKSADGAMYFARTDLSGPSYMLQVYQ